MFNRLFEPLTASAVRAASRLTVLPAGGCLRVPGLTAAVKVRFDDFHVPHIEAESDADAFRAHGVCHALDRFYQMDMLRRVLSGRTSALVGERKLGAMASAPFTADHTTVDTDRFMRILGLERASAGVWRNAPDDAKALLLAYTEGVNAVVPWLRRRRPLEHRLLGGRIKPWKPIDSILVAKGMALGLSFKWRAGIVFAAMAEQLGEHPEHLLSALPSSPGTDETTMLRWLEGQFSASLGLAPTDAPLAGSNAWLVGGDRSASGKPMIASDPHLELALPSTWYLTSMKGARYQAVGCSLPGLPGVVIGRTPSTAWGLTNGMIDDADFWTEQVDDAGRRYKVDGAWRPLEIENETIHRKGGSPVVLRVRRTHRGPLITDAFGDRATTPMSLRLTCFEPVPDLVAFVGIGRARTARDTLLAGRLFGSPAQNLLVADSDGNGGFRLIGSVPTREPNVHPGLPRDGTTAASDWTGWVPDSELPALELAADDVIVQANHAHVGPPYPHYLSHLYEPSYRADRIRERLDAAGPLDAAAMQDIQHDALNLCAARFKRVVLEPHAEAARRRRPVVGALLDRLLAWDGDERAETPGAAPWHLVYSHLLRRTFEPVLGPELVKRWMSLVNFVDEPLFAAFEDEQSPWAPPNVRATLLCEALDDTLKEMARRGLTVDTPWGDFHTLTLHHPVGAGPLAAAFNQGPYPMAGGPYTPSAAPFNHARPASMTVGASYRHVVDLSAPEEGRMITYGGQSGYPGSPHYGDLTPLWRGRGTVPMRLEPPPDPESILDLLP